jgi:hypothetical protein
MKSGIYIRAERGGKWGPYDITELNAEEIRKVLAEKEPAELINWVVALAKIIEQLEEVEE